MSRQARLERITDIEMETAGTVVEMVVSSPDGITVVQVERDDFELDADTDGH